MCLLTIQGQRSQAAPPIRISLLTDVLAARARLRSSNLTTSLRAITWSYPLDPVNVRLSLWRFGPRRIRVSLTTPLLASESVVYYLFVRAMRLIVAQKGARVRFA